MYKLSLSTMKKTTPTNVLGRNQTRSAHAVKKPTRPIVAQRPDESRQAFLRRKMKEDKRYFNRLSKDDTTHLVEMQKALIADAHDRDLNRVLDVICDHILGHTDETVAY